MEEVKKLCGTELQNASWEDAKAFCEAQEREMFETAKANGGYWLSAMAYLDMKSRYVESRLNDHDYAIARKQGIFAGMLIGAMIGAFFSVTAAFVIRAILSG